MNISEEYITKNQAMRAYCDHFCHPGPRCPASFDGYCKEVRDTFGSLESVAFIIEEKTDMNKPLTESQIELLKYIHDRFSEQIYDGTWIFPDGKTERCDMGYAWNWFYECLLKELGIDENDLE